MQVLAGAVVVAVVVLGDAPTGLILGLALLVLTARVNARALGIDLSAWGLDFGKPSAPGDLLRAYVTPKNLHDAQSNRVSERDDEVKGFEGVYGEPVYGAQGLDKAMPAFAAPEFLGSDL